MGWLRDCFCLHFLKPNDGLIFIGPLAPPYGCADNVGSDKCAGQQGSVISTAGAEADALVAETFTIGRYGPCHDCP